MKKIYLLRHAKAEHNSRIDDHERPLSPEGITACSNVAAVMQQYALFPDVVICSPSARTRGTLERITENYDLDTDLRFLPSLYSASAGEILSAINALEDHFNSVLVVGHNPGLHYLSILLAGRGDPSLITSLKLSFPTAGLAVLESDTESWKGIEANSCTLTGLFTSH